MAVIFSWQGPGALSVMLLATFALAHVAQRQAERLTAQIRAELAGQESGECLMALPVRWMHRLFVFWLLVNALWLSTVAALSMPQCLATVLVLAVLGMLALVDAETGILPNELVLLLMLLAWGYSWVIRGDGLPTLDRLWGMTLGYALPMFFNLAYRWVRARDAMGQGDAKLLAAIGLWVGLTDLADIWIIASALLLVYTAGSTFANRATMRLKMGIPFGPFLVLGTNALVIYESF
jgi:prepilin signal peptidase PulO-like enzyme (type II secretory pathway)